jgi:putative endonuclease
MYYVYLLKSKKTEWVYIGYTSDLRKRVEEHRSGKSLTTRRYLPIELVYYEAYRSATDAMKREKTLKKYGNVIGLLKKRIVNSIK